MRSRTQKIADMAVFIALGIILNLISFSSFGLYLGRISLVYAFCYLAGFILGPWQGFAVAFLADLIPAIFLPVGPYAIMISLSNACMALIAGCFHRFTDWKFGWKLAATVLTAFVICSLGLTVYGEVGSIFVFPVGGFAKARLYDIYPYTLAKTIIGLQWGVSNPFLQMMIAKAIQQPLWIAFNVLLTATIYLRLRPVFEKSGFFKSRKKDERLRQSAAQTLSARE